MRRNYRGNIAHEITRWSGTSTGAFATRYGTVTESQSKHIVGVNSRVLRTGALRDRQWEACG